MKMELKQIFLQIHTEPTEKEKMKRYVRKLGCPYCQEKNLNQLVQIGENNIKCMSCCNFYDCYFD